jgi:hypothetical protein
VADATTTAVGEYRPTVKGSILLEIGISIFTCSLSLLKTASILVLLENLKIKRCQYRSRGAILLYSYAVVLSAFKKRRPRMCANCLWIFHKGNLNWTDFTPFTKIDNSMNMELSSG